VSACPACGSGELEQWRAATGEDGEPQRRTYPLVRCRRCGTAALPDRERPARPTALYAMSGSNGPAPVAAAIEGLRKLIDLDRRRVTAALPPRSRVFEVGVGDGRLLALLAARGHAVAGIEPSPERAESARARGIVVATATLEETELPPGSHDAIVLWHVLEHLDDPRAALARMRPWLVPGGRLLVAVPNGSSLQAAIGGDRWFHQDVPRHLVQFTTRGVVLLLARSGFHVTRVRHVLLEQNLFGMWQTLLNRLTRDRNVAFALVRRGPSRRRPIARDAVTVALAGPPLVPVAVALELASGLVRRGGTVVVEATLDP